MTKSRKRMSGFPELIDINTALNILMEKINFKPVRVVNVPLEESLGRICGDDIYSPCDIPPFDRSAVDGYAVRAEDTFGASPTNPVSLRIVGTIQAGDTPDKIPDIGEGEAVEILTGAPLPRGANAVVMVEHSRKTGEDTVEVMKQVHPMQNVSRKGEDFQREDIVIRKGVRIRPWHIGALASLNITSIPVYDYLRIAILSTGSELVEPGEETGEGKVINSSKPMLKALVREMNCICIDLGTVEDELEVIASKIREGLEKADMVIVTGGTSVGEKDLVPEAVSKAGLPGVVFHGVKIRPAKPTGAGVVDGKPVFMLSGYPVSALIGFQTFVKPVIEKFYNMHREEPCKVRGRLTRRVVNPVETRSFMRVKVEKRGGEYVVEPLMLTGSGLLSTLTKANGILVIPEGVEGYDENEEVEVELLSYMI